MNLENDLGGLPLGGLYPNPRQQYKIVDLNRTKEDWDKVLRQAKGNNDSLETYLKMRTSRRRATLYFI